MKHSYDDGLGPRTVFVNGEKIERVMHADTDSGVVEVVDFPLSVEKIDGEYLFKTHKISGNVEVVPV